MKEWNCYTNADKLLKLRWPTYEPTTFLLVWWFGGDKKHNCHSIIARDYESAEYCALEFITLNKVEHAVLYKSAVKINNTNKQHVFRVYVPLAFYSGDKYKLTKMKNCFTAPIEIWRDENSYWHADYIKIKSLEYDEIKTAIYTNYDRVYGRKKENENYHDFNV